MTEKSAIVGADGLLYRQPNQPISTMVNSAMASVMSFPVADLIVFRLYEAGGTATTIGAEIPPEEQHQFRMTPSAARRLAKMLIDGADEIEGRGYPVQ